MESTESLVPEAFLHEDKLGYIKPEEFESLGIEATDIQPGTFAARKHPSKLLSRFGGNAYGFGFFEVYERLSARDLKLIQSITPKNPDYIRQYHKEINRIYKKIGLLIRFSKLGKPYYLIPMNLLLSSLSTVKNKSEEVSKIIDYHRKKFLKENHKIGLVTHADDLIINDLSLRFKEHEFVVLDSFERIRNRQDTLDLIIVARDIYEIVFMEKFSSGREVSLSKKQLDNYATYVLGKIYHLLKQDGEIFVIATKIPLKSDRWISLTFNTPQELKNFILFSHIFKTKKKYQAKGQLLRVNSFDFQKYLSQPYVEKEVLDRLLGGGEVEKLSPKELNDLPYLNFSLEDELAHDQEKTWSKLLSTYFDKIFLKPLRPLSVREDWEERFSAEGYVPDCMLIYLGQKKALQTTFEEVKKDIMESELSGCPLSLLAEYRDSFDYVNRTLNVLRKIKNRSYSGLPELFMERLKEPLESRKRRYAGLNDVIRLMSKVKRLETIKQYLNPGNIEGARTPVLKNLEALSLFGLTYGELKEIFLVVVGHTPMGRILSGKMNEKALKPLSDLARTHEPQQALNLLRYCRLMSMAETAASKRTDLNQEELAELFDLYESTVKVVTNRDMDWDRLLDEKISAMGGIHNKVVRKILKMMNHFQFLTNWSELSHKGEKEKEALADYDEDKLARIADIIQLVKIIDQFENMYFRDDPLQASIFYRKFLNMEFHGTVHLFEMLDSKLVFLLLWITVNVAKGDVINFNPILADADPSTSGDFVNKLEQEVHAINMNYLDLGTVKQFSKELYEDQASFIVGTGFQLRVNPQTQAVDISYIDMDKNILELDSHTKAFMGSKISDIPVEKLEAMERLFSNLEGFYQSHLRLISHDDSDLRLPERQREWFDKAQRLQETIKSNFTSVIFQPEEIFTDLDLLDRHAPSLLGFVLPEFTALREPSVTESGPSLADLVLASTRKLQALVRHDRTSFHDVQFLHKLARREFGPMAAGIVGLNEFQIETLENLVLHLRKNPALFDALMKSFVFRDVGLLSGLREKYEREINPSDHAQASALILEREKICERYDTDEEARYYVLHLVEHHNLIHHMVRGEYSFYAIQEVVDLQDKDLFDAIFLSSFIMFSALGEDLIMEDLATLLFQFRSLCHRIIAGETTPESHLEGLFAQKGFAFHAFESNRKDEISESMPSANAVESVEWRDSDREHYVAAGRMVYAMERIFRMRGIRYIEFADLANLMLKVPLKYIYRKKTFSGVGYATFERELFEALRIYNGLQLLPEEGRHFIFQHLVSDEVRVIGLEKVSNYLSYENLIKLLLIAMLATQKFKKSEKPVYVSFLEMAGKIGKRYEAINDVVSGIPMQKIWENPYQLTSLFKAKTGVVLARHDPQRVLTIDFVDRINIPQKISHMKAIQDVEQLKNYFHYSLRSLRANPFHTDDYELELEKAFDQSLEEITDQMLDQAKRQMELRKDFGEIHKIYQDLMERSLDIGFTEEQRHRLSDLYEIRKDNLKREKLEEMGELLEALGDVQELQDYWDSVKWYLLNNRPYLGKEFEHLIAKKFDEAMARIVEARQKT